MTQILASLAGVLLLATTGPNWQQPGPRVSRLGAARSYGPGIVQASITELKFELTRPAHIIILQVDPSGGITPIFPPGDADSGERPPGVHAVTAPAPVVATAEEARISDPVLRTADELARSGRAVRPPAVSAGEETAVLVYWLVIASDVATSGREVRTQLESTSLAYRSVDDELRALPGILVGKRIKGWGAYYTAVR